MAVPLRPPKFCVIGGGISGLATAYFLQNGFLNAPSGSITVVEKSNKFGGCIQSMNTNEFQFEFGPKYFHMGLTGNELLGLIKRLKIHNEIIHASSREASLRYYLLNDKIKATPSRMDVFQYLPGIVSELLTKPNTSQLEDECIYSFSKRHLGEKITNEICNAAIFSTYFGDINELSIKSYLPLAWTLDRVYGSIILGSYRVNGRHSNIKLKTSSWLATHPYEPLQQSIKFKGKDLYTLRGGCYRLIEALTSHLQYPEDPYKAVNMITSNGVHRIIRENVTAEEGSPLKIELNDGSCIEADCIIAAIPSYELAAIINRSSIHSATPCTDTLTSFSHLLSSIPYTSVINVNVGYIHKQMKRKHRGSGYYSAVHPKADVIGMSWDSQLFPTVCQTQPPKVHDVTRISGTVRSLAVTSCLEAEERFVAAIQKYLQINIEPTVVHSVSYDDAIPQYIVGHSKLIKSLQTLRQEALPWLQIVGAPYNGMLVSECILDARILSDQLIQRYAYFPFVVEEEASEWNSRGSERYTIKSNE